MIDQFLSHELIRPQAEKIFKLCQAGMTHFELQLEELPKATELVIAVMRENYPDFNIPYHSRWNHFQAGGVDRRQRIYQKLSPLPREERLLRLIDLTLISVFLDAGAGMDWRFQEEGSYSKSEGLALASLALFEGGVFGPSDFQVQAQKLAHLKLAQLEEGFQVRSDNPLVGLPQRLELLKRLGGVCHQKNIVRPSEVFVSLLHQKEILASDILKIILKNFTPLFPGPLALDSTPLGDVWPYENEWIPFHKLSQWLSYSLIEVFEREEIKVLQIDDLTGLPEYRNGGLFLDTGVLRPRDQNLYRKTLTVDSKAVIEWRALTIILLDTLAQDIRQQLNLPLAEWPLVKILEGGTWWAGRKIATQKRANGGPPLMLDTQGIFF